MIQPKSFYEGFQINHYDIKQINNKYLLDMSDDEIEKVTSKLIKSSKEEFLRSVKMDVRFTYLLAIETLFEIIFALIPDDPKLNDHQILRFLTKRANHYEDIRCYANSEPSKLDTLDGKAVLNNGEESSLWHYMLYLGLGGDEYRTSIDESLKAIQKALKLFAKDLSDRDELNGYKHGLRGIRHMVSFQTSPKGSPEKQYLNFHTNDALSFYSFDSKSEEHVIKTMEFDSDRDINMTHLASNILYCIIEPRKYIYGNKIGEEIRYIYFKEEDLDKASKPNVKFQNMIFRYKVDETKSEQ
ncbi:MAG: hypothetical protein ABJG78_12465 [Cyclobacteriaceae bacterium]